MDTRYAGGIARYSGGSCGCGLYDISMVDKMMLKYRPIAPKQVASGSGSSDSTTKNFSRSGRGKKSFKVIKRSEGNKTRKTQASTEKVSRMVTLPLMPETPDCMKLYPTMGNKQIPPPVWFCFKKNNQASRDHQTSRDGHVTPDRPQTVSFVTVEHVMEMNMGEWTDTDQDTCPRFISDGGDRVVWTNKAYKEMAAGGEDVVVVLVRKEGGWPEVFTCNVRVTCRTGMRDSTTTLTVPCDAWRMGGGGYAWRLDVKAALCLGR